MLTCKPVPVGTWQDLIPPVLDYRYFENAAQLPFDRRTAGLSLINAWWLSEAALLAYADESFARPRFLAAGFNRIQFFDGPSTRCYLAANDHLAIVTFRGTESWMKTGLSQFLADLKTDLNFRLVNHAGGGRIHKGFESALDEVWSDLLVQLKKMPDCPLWLTGHSLGGALATLAAARYERAQSAYTFGSPRVGDADFARRLRVPVCRFVHQNDIITKMPPAPFSPVGRLCRIDSRGRLRFHEPERPPLLDGLQQTLERISRALQELKLTSAAVLPESFKDHAPLLYAVHIWNILAADLADRQR